MWKYIEKRVFSVIFLRLQFHVSVWLVLPQQHGWGLNNKWLKHIIHQYKQELVCLYMQEKQFASWIQHQWSCWQHVHLGAKCVLGSILMSYKPQTCCLLAGKLFSSEGHCVKRHGVQEDLGLKYLHLMQHLRCVGTLHCKTGKKKKNCNEKEHVSPRWCMAWFTVHRIQQRESRCVFSGVWHRWMRFKLPNRSQYSSELGQMESARHSRDDSGNRWVSALFWEGSRRTHS